MPTRIPDLSTCKKLGFIVPSSNTVVEPTCNAIIHDLNASNPDSPPLICLYTRIRVKTVGTDSASTSQFSTSTLVDAAQLLADAECDAILWNGTSGMWVGSDLAADEALATAMTDATAVPCSTTTLATVRCLREKGFRNVGVATPYDEALTQKCKDFFTACGFNVTGTARMEPTPPSNIAIGKSSSIQIGSVLRAASNRSSSAEAVVAACTNWAGAGLAEALAGSETALVDSVTVTVWMALRMVGWEGTVDGWGEVMESLRGRSEIDGREGSGAA